MLSWTHSEKTRPSLFARPNSFHYYLIRSSYRGRVETRRKRHTAKRSLKVNGRANRTRAVLISSLSLMSVIGVYIGTRNKTLLHTIVMMIVVVSYNNDQLFCNFVPCCLFTIMRRVSFTAILCNLFRFPIQFSIYFTLVNNLRIF